jgi:hypothetical protein
MIKKIKYYLQITMATGEMDMITKRPRTPRDPYTTLTDIQINNLKKVKKLI